MKSIRVPAWAILTGLVVSLVSIPIHVMAAAIPIGVPGEIYTQSFDSLPNHVDWQNKSLVGSGYEFQDEVTVPDWIAYHIASLTEGGNHRLRITSGNTNVGSFYSFGDRGATDRALGDITSSTTNTARWGTRFVNNTGAMLTEFTLSYVGEQWRDGGGTTASVAQGIRFGYSMNAGSIVDTAASGLIYTEVPELEFVSPNVGRTTAAALNGNAPENRTALSATITGLNWLPGEELWIRWIDNDNSGNDHGLGIDDLSFTAVPEPATIILLMLGCAGLTRRRD